MKKFDLSSPEHQKLVSNFLKHTLLMAEEKGLKIKRHQFNDGWTIILPTGHLQYAKSNVEMLAYIRGYSNEQSK